MDIPSPPSSICPTPSPYPTHSLFYHDYPPLLFSLSLPLSSPSPFCPSPWFQSGRPQVSVSSKQVKVSSCMDEVMAFYFETCDSTAAQGGRGVVCVGVSCVMYDLLSCALAEEGVDGLPIFATELSKFLCYSTARELATVIFGDSALSGSCIASWCVGCGVRVG